MSNDRVECKLSDIAELIRGVTYKKSQVLQTGDSNAIPLLRATNISDILDFYDCVYVSKECISDEQLLKKSDIVLAASSGSKHIVGKSAILNSKWFGSFGAFCFCIRCNKNVSANYISYIINSKQYRDKLSELSAGSNINNLKREHILGLKISIPPYAEQKRIVTKIEELFSCLDAGVAALERIQGKLKQYRASLLKSAVEGRLTADWRKNNPPSESGAELLARILKERRAKWEEEQLAAYQASGKTPPKNWRDKYKEPVAPDTKDLPSLPEGWCWASLEQLSDTLPNSLAIGPFGSDLKVSDYCAAGVPLVFVRNIRSQNFNTSQFVSPEKAEQLRRHYVYPGEILITKMGDPPGDSCIYPETREPAIITADCIKAALLKKFCISKCYNVFVTSQCVQRQILQMTSGVAQKKVSLEKIRKLALPVLSISEQEKVISTLENVTSSITMLPFLQVIKARASRLRQAILKKAFEGRLVPQAPNDEPASVLLERIRKEREATQAAKPKQTRRPRKKKEPSRADS